MPITRTASSGRGYAISLSFAQPRLGDNVRSKPGSDFRSHTHVVAQSAGRNLVLGEALANDLKPDAMPVLQLLGNILPPPKLPRTPYSKLSSGNIRFGFRLALREAGESPQSVHHLVHALDCTPAGAEREDKRM